MPELPEVETTRRGIAPHLVGRRIEGLVVRQARLRWPVPRSLSRALAGREVLAVRRRAKYLLIDVAGGSAIVHLGMSGSLRVLARDAPPRAHDHVDLALAGGALLRYNDPRRFGCWLWQPRGRTHALLEGLGPEPLSDDFDGDHLWRRSRGRTVPVKAFLMDQSIVVGVGNIYAAEALYAAGIAPTRPAGRVSRGRYGALAAAVRAILARAIERGGTTLRDFLNPDGAPGYFEQELMVYGRGGEPCRACGSAIVSRVIGQRASFSCPRCQR